MSKTIIINNKKKRRLTVSQDDHHVAALACAESESRAVVFDHDEPPDCQDQRVPDGHPVQDVTEVGVEQEEHTPAVGILKLGGKIRFTQRF